MYILIVTTTTDAELAKAVHFLCNPRMKITPGEDYTFFRHYTLWAHISYTAQWATHCTVYNVYTSMPKTYPMYVRALQHTEGQRRHMCKVIYMGAVPICQTAATLALNYYVNEVRQCNDGQNYHWPVSSVCAGLFKNSLVERAAPANLDSNSTLDPGQVQSR